MTLVLLHGTAGNETDLMPLARRIAPHSALLGVRGRATEEGSNRWFRRIDAATFDQADIRSEAEAFSAFVEGAVVGYGLDPEKLVFVGYSNGANILAAVIQLHPGVVRRAVLLRATLLSILVSPSRVRCRRLAKLADSLGRPTYYRKKYDCRVELRLHVERSSATNFYYQYLLESSQAKRARLMVNFSRMKSITFRVLRGR